MITSRLLLSTAALAALLVTGCAKGDTTGSNVSSSTTASAAPAASSDASSGTAMTTSSPGASSTTADSQAHSAAVSVASGDATHGGTIFSANCASCHGANGAGGGIGPSLKGEKSRKDMAAAIAWIKNPQAPMPKLYPAPLSEKDVSDVAAYVESL